MKTRITLIAVLIIGLAGFGTLSFATEKKTTGIAKVSAPTNMVVTQIEVKGLVKQTKAGLFLYDGNETYLLKGEKILETLVGRLVKINGELQKSENGSAILVKTALKVN